MATSALPPPLRSPRPLSVAVISWILIVRGGIAGACYPFVARKISAEEKVSRDLLPVPVQITLACTDILVMLLSGIFMLQGANWARYLYIGWTLASDLIALFTSSLWAEELTGLLFYGLVVYFLTRPEASAFFKGMRRRS